MGRILAISRSQTRQVFIRSSSTALGYLLKRTMAMLSTALDQELARYDLTHPQYSILMILSGRHGYTRSRSCA